MNLLFFFFFFFFFPSTFCGENIIFLPNQRKNSEGTMYKAGIFCHLVFLLCEKRTMVGIDSFAIFYFNSVISADSVICAGKKKLTSSASFFVVVNDALSSFLQTFTLASVCRTKVHSQFCRKDMTQHCIIPFELILLL